jgi:hypothetical protein
MQTDMTQGSIEEQLDAIYAEREWLAQELGVAHAEGGVDMVRNLEAQLCDFYRQFGGRAPVSNHETLQLLNYVQELSQHLDQMYTEKSVTFSIEDEKPVIKATWKETLNNQGDTK